MRGDLYPGKCQFLYLAYKYCLVAQTLSWLLGVVLFVHFVFVLQLVAYA